MKFEKTPIDDLFVVEFDKFVDNRGSFSRLSWGQACVSWNPNYGTLRGLHFQREPYGEKKLVSCLAGKIFDVAVDLRPKSKTFKAWFSIELSAEKPLGLLIPEGFAHGFITLCDASIVHYVISQDYQQSYQAGIRWDDPVIGIRWPMNPKIISDRDRNYAFI